MVLLLNKEVKKRLGDGAIPGLRNILHSVLVQLILLAKLDSLVPAVVLLVQVGSYSAELKEFMLLKLLGQCNIVEVVEVIDRLAQASVVLFINQQLVKCLVHSLDVVLLNSGKVGLNKREVVCLREELHGTSVVDARREDRQQVSDKERVRVEVEVQSSVIMLNACNLNDDILEAGVIPSLGGVLDHGKDSIVELVIVHIEEHKGVPQLSLLGSAENLGDVDTRPEELKVLHHLLRAVLGVEDGKLGEHTHVGTLKAKTSLEERDKLIKVAASLIVVDKLLKLVSVDNNVETANLGKAELLSVNAGIAHTLPGLGAVGLAGAVNGSLVLTEEHESGGELGEVRDVVVQKLGSLVHAIIEAPVTNKLDLCNVGAGDELLKIGQTVCPGEGEDELSLNNRLTSLLAGHLEIAHKVLEVTLTVSRSNHLLVGGRVISLDVAVDGLLDHGRLELGTGEKAPDLALVAALGKLVGTVQ
eukprot:Colp12_sorted_trinity150504_noHs@23513